MALSPPSLHQEVEVVNSNGGMDVADSLTAPAFPIDGMEEFAAPLPRRRAANDNRQPSSTIRCTSDITFSVNRQGQDNCFHQPPNSRHFNMIDRVDRGNYIASQNLDRMDSFLYSPSNHCVQ